MIWVDMAIVFVVALAVLGGISQGFFRSFCSLAGLVLGVAVAAWNYQLAAALLAPILGIEALANAIGFLLIALLVMGLAAMAGKILFKTVHGIGLGCLDRLAGAAFGFLQGALLVMLVILVAVAFFPSAHWLAEATLPRLFFRACHLSTHMSPEGLAERIKHGLKLLEEESPRWLHPGGSGA
ncbi:MAG: CvpA family protein [Terracidiphilus sp.]|jgi:membrane protein required for colicin V production